MVNADAVRMDPQERDEFLGTSGTGVISLSVPNEEPPHSIPVSYGYDPVDGTFYFRLAIGPESEKGDLEGRAVAFVTHRQINDQWKSVVAAGHLTSTTDDESEIEALAGLDRVTIPLIDIFGKPTRNVTFEFYRLSPNRFSGRVEQPSTID